MQNLIQNKNEIYRRINEATRLADRKVEDVRLIWVSKTHPLETVNRARELGVLQFGENKVQECVQKFTEKPHGEELHLIGPLQSNKMRKAVQLADWIHTIDRLDKVERLDRICQEEARHLQVLFQVNTSQEETKSGISLNEVQKFLLGLPLVKNLTYRGLMTIPTPQNELECRTEFRLLKELQSDFMTRDERFMAFDQLSMGMSSDLEWAIAEGSTMIRVGTALFGKRD